MDPIAITDLRGGLNTTDPAFSLPADQTTVCENMDMTRGTLGGRRAGHAAVTTSGLSRECVFLHRHLPTSVATAAELWAISASGTTSVFAYKNTAWNVVTPTGAMALDVAGKYAIRGQSLHGKLFLAYPTVSGTDRLHVWDGSSIRKAGLAAPAAPSVANTGSGSFSGTRYYRVRYTVRDGSGVTIRRSEPSAVTTFAPSGTGAAARITKPATISEGETIWEIEESIDNVNFYRIHSSVVGTTTHDDSLTTAQVASQGVLSEDVGDYTLLWNPKFLSADQDRLLIAGSWQQAALQSRIGWTPVFGASGAGNDERQESDTDPFLDLDSYDGGEITEFLGPVSGYHYAFKEQRIYKIIRTYARSQAYQAVPITDASGAMKRSGVKGLDERGRPCVYYLDRNLGPSRVGANGVEHIGGDILTTWQAVNKDASIVGHGVYYSGEVWWWVAGSGQTLPSFKIKANVKEFRDSEDGKRRGWSTDTGAAMATLCSTLYSDNIEAGTDRSLTLVPLVGTGIIETLILRCDTGTQDVSTNYRSYVRTRPNLMQGLLGKGGVMSGTLTAPASAATVRVRLIRDYGLETQDFDISIAAAASETHVVRPVDNLNIAELRALQVEIGDSAAVNQDWVLDALVLQMRNEESV